VAGLEPAARPEKASPQGSSEQPLRRAADELNSEKS